MQKTAVAEKRKRLQKNKKKKNQLNKNSKGIWLANLGFFTAVIILYHIYAALASVLNFLTITSVLIQIGIILICYFFVRQPLYFGAIRYSAAFGNTLTVKPLSSVFDWLLEKAKYKTALYAVFLYMIKYLFAFLSCSMAGILSIFAIYTFVPLSNLYKYIIMVASALFFTVFLLLWTLCIWLKKQLLIINIVENPEASLKTSNPITFVNEYGKKINTYCKKKKRIMLKDALMYFNRYLFIVFAELCGITALFAARLSELYPDYANALLNEVTDAGFIISLGQLLFITLSAFSILAAILTNPQKQTVYMGKLKDKWVNLYLAKEYNPSYKKEKLKIKTKKDVLIGDTKII